MPRLPDAIGGMADRILITADKIGEMAARIVATEGPLAQTLLQLAGVRPGMALIPVCTRPPSNGGGRACVAADAGGPTP